VLHVYISFDDNQILHDINSDVIIFEHKCWKIAR